MELESLKRWLLKERGFDCDQYSDSFLQRRLAVRLRACNILSYTDYVRILKSDDEEYDKLLGTLSINVTRFFRDETVWDAIEKRALPGLISRKVERGESSIRVWSAGCSTGEETYSIAMLLEPFAEQFATLIYGTDRDLRSLDKAREGVYTASSVKGLKPKRLSKLERKGDEYGVRDEIKGMVKFMKHDLLEDKYLKGMDLILCRNVLIYFKKDAQKQVVSSFWEALRGEGYMVLGRVETIFDEIKERFTPFDLMGRIYRRPKC